MKKTKMPYLILSILIGIFIFIYGGKDDSPGAQLLGLIFIIIGIWGLIKRKNHNKLLK